MFDIGLLERVIRRVEVDEGVDGWSLVDEAAYIHWMLASEQHVHIDLDTLFSTLTAMDERGRTLRRRRR